MTRVSRKRSSIASCLRCYLTRYSGRKTQSRHRRTRSGSKSRACSHFNGSWMTCIRWFRRAETDRTFSGPVVGPRRTSASGRKRTFMARPPPRQKKAAIRRPSVGIWLPGADPKALSFSVSSSFLSCMNSQAPPMGRGRARRYTPFDSIKIGLKW